MGFLSDGGGNIISISLLLLPILVLVVVVVVLPPCFIIKESDIAVVVYSETLIIFEFSIARELLEYEYDVK